MFFKELIQITVLIISKWSSELNNSTNDISNCIFNFCCKSLPRRNAYLLIAVRTHSTLIRWGHLNIILFNTSILYYSILQYYHFQYFDIILFNFQYYHFQYFNIIIFNVLILSFSILQYYHFQCFDIILFNTSILSYSNVYFKELSYQQSDENFKNNNLGRSC